MIPPVNVFSRYTGALLAAIAALLLRWVLEAFVGGSLPHYVIFYPVVMFVSLAAGLGPGLVATAAAALLADYFVLQPAGFGILRPVDALGLLLFSAMGIFMSLIAERLRRSSILLKETVAERTRELRHKEENLRFHLENSPMAVIEWDKDFIVTRWAGVAETMFGWSAAETIGKPIADLKIVFEEDLPLVQTTMARLTDGVSPQDVAINRNISRSGKILYCTWYNSVLTDQQGQMISVLSKVIDITEQKKAEEALRRSKEEWERTFDSVPDLIAIIDDHHRLVRVNRAMAERLNCGPEKCVGMHCYEAIHGSNLPPEFCPHSRTLADGGGHHVELFEERIGGDYLVSTTPLLDQEGRMTGSVHVARDISELKRAQEDLRLARDTAEAATSAKSQFLANMSHELRTPMTGVIGMLDLVLAGRLEAEQKEFIEIAQTSASSLVRLLNDILDLTKIEAGKFSLEENPFSLRKCVETTYNVLLPLARGKGLDFNFTVAEDVAETMVGDQLRLNQVMTNLAGNAVKFTERGTVEILVTAGSSAADGRQEIDFTVSDTGIGIADAKKHLLFSVFSQVDDSHSRIYGGSGLGLAISKEIVERMGGRITFMSTEGKGSTFSFTLPFRKIESGHDTFVASGKPAPEENSTDAAPAAKARILVAEDEPTIRKFLDVMLQRADFETDFAENGEKAVAMWETGKFDLILMDVQMPHMDGFDAAAAIRMRGGKIPIIAMTGHAFKEDEERCLDAGMNAYISKPIDYRKCLQIIRDNLENNGT